MTTSADGSSSGRRLDLGQKISGADGPLGEVLDVVINPVGRSVTHLVVGPRQHHDQAHLLPIETVSPSDDGTLVSSLTSADTAALPVVEDRDFFRLADWPTPTDQWDVGIVEVLALPYHSMDFAPDLVVDGPTLMGFDRIPIGEVEIRRLSSVVDGDGEPAGHVESFIVDGDDHITHLVVDRGHLWTHREITVPIGSARRMRNDEVQLDLTAEELSALPAARYHRHR